LKLRIKGDSLRLRLTQGEVRSLEEQGSVADAICFGPDSKLEYRVRRDGTVDGLTVKYQANIIEVCVPEAMALKWCRSDLVTLECTRPTATGELRILVEKDFTCLVPRSGEDESDHFPHPKAKAGA
jgi:hypothetical protein